LVSGGAGRDTLRGNAALDAIIFSTTDADDLDPSELNESIDTDLV
jgi:hypothetical protein